MCVSTLAEICRKYGDSQANPFKLAHMYWHKAHPLYEECQCLPGKTRCDRVQVLLPPLSTRRIRPEPFAQAKRAVIFGRSFTFPWEYPNQGLPSEDNSGNNMVSEEMSPNAQEPLVSDSSLGSSIQTAITNNNRDSPQDSRIPSNQVSQPALLSPAPANESKSKLGGSESWFSRWKKTLLGRNSGKYEE